MCIRDREYAVNQAKLHHWKLCYCDQTMLEGMRRRTEIIEILKQKLQEQAFVMVYQPILEVKTGRISAVAVSYTHLITSAFYAELTVYRLYQAVNSYFKIPPFNL